MKITLLTAASEDYWPILELSAPNKLEYCLRHKLQLSIKKHIQMTAHERTQYMIDSLRECDWLWFMGADTLITNQTIDVRQFLDSNYDFIIGLDVNGINNDSFFLKNTPASFEFLDLVYDYNDTEPNDQESMNKAMLEVEGFKYNIVHQKLFNSYLYSEYHYPDSKGGDFTDGDFVLHLPGIPNSRRIPLMKEYLQKVKR